MGIALQGIDNFEDWFQPSLEKLGYESTFAPMPGKDCGCALCWRQDTLRLRSLDKRPHEWANGVNGSAYGGFGARRSAPQCSVPVLIAELATSGEGEQAMAPFVVAVGQFTGMPQVEQLAKRLSRYPYHLRQFIMAASFTSDPGTPSAACPCSAYRSVLGVEPSWSASQTSLPHVADYIFTSGGIKAQRVLSIQDMAAMGTSADSYPSNHCMLMTELEMIPPTELEANLKDFRDLWRLKGPAVIGSFIHPLAASACDDDMEIGMRLWALFIVLRQIAWFFDAHARDREGNKLPLQGDDERQQAKALGDLLKSKQAEFDTSSVAPELVQFEFLLGAVQDGVRLLTVDNVRERAAAVEAARAFLGHDAEGWTPLRTASFSGGSRPMRSVVGVAPVPHSVGLPGVRELGRELRGLLRRKHKCDWRVAAAGIERLMQCALTAGGEGLCAGYWGRRGGLPGDGGCDEWGEAGLRLCVLDGQLD